MPSSMMSRLTIPSNAFCIETAGIFLHSHCCPRKLPNSDWLLWLRYIPDLILDVSLKENP